MSVKHLGNSRPALFAVVLALMLEGLSQSSSVLAQTLESRVGTLEVHDEILRSRQEVMGSDFNEFNADVSAATEALRAEMKSIHSLPAADGDPTEAIYIDEDGNVGIGTSEPEARLHVSGGKTILATDWVTPATSELGAGWVYQYPGTKFAYCKDSFGMVHLRGRLSHSTNAKTGIFTFPEGYRPIQDTVLSVVAYIGTFRAAGIYIGTNGGMGLGIENVTGGGAVYLDGLSFWAGY